MKKVFISIIALLACLCALTGCDSVNNQERDYTETIKQQSMDTIGLPNVSNFFEMGQLKEIYEMRDNPDLIMYWYTKNQMTGKWVYEGQCIGYGIPYGASITSPETYVSGIGEIIPQAEPNGLYTNTVSSSATWVLALDDEGEIQPTYVEMEIYVTPVKVDANRCEPWSIENSDY